MGAEIYSIFMDLFRKEKRRYFCHISLISLEIPEDLSFCAQMVHARSMNRHAREYEMHFCVPNLFFFPQCLLNSDVWHALSERIRVARENLARRATEHEANACLVLQVRREVFDIHFCSGFPPTFNAFQYLDGESKSPYDFFSV